MNAVPAPDPDVFRLPLRIYWEDTDAGGIVFYANYLKFFERARTEWLRTLGFGQQNLVEQTGCMFVVLDTQVRYLKPARLDDLIEVSAVVTARTGVTLTIAQRATLDGQLLAEGTIRIGCVQRASLRPTRIPAPLLEALT